MSIGVPGSIAIRKAILKTNAGAIDLRQMAREIRVFESMMRPYQVTEMHIMDTTGFGNQLKLEGGEELDLVVNNVYGDIYEIKAKLTKQTNDVATASLRSQSVHLSFADDGYFRNKTAKVQASYKNVIGSSVINEIHSKFIGGSISRLSPSKGFIAEKQPYIVSNKRPWDAIKAIRYSLTSARYAKSGAYCYYKDKNGHCLIPLEEALNELQLLGYFVQDGTVGRSFFDVKRLENQIIAFQGGTSFGSSLDPAMVAQNQSGVTHSFDLQQKSFIKGQLNQTPIPGIKSAFPITRNLFGQLERVMHYIPHDPNLRQQEPRIEKDQGEKLLGHLTQTSGTYTMMVLFDRGINLTVGRGVHARLATPQGDLTAGYHVENRFGGPALVVNLCHHWKNYDTQPQGTTTLECAQGGFKQ